MVPGKQEAAFREWNHIRRSESSLKAAQGLFQRHALAGHAGELLGNLWKGWLRNAAPYGRG